MAQTGGTITAKPPLLSVLGANVYRLRVLRLPKLQQETLAEKAGVSVNTLARIEAARDPDRAIATSQPQLDTVEALARALEVDPAELLRWDEATRVFLGGNAPDLVILPGSETISPNGIFTYLSNRRRAERRAFQLPVNRNRRAGYDRRQGDEWAKGA